MGGPRREPRHRWARKRRSADLGAKLGLGLLEAAAEAIIAIVNQRMAGRTRLLSIERGLDPRDFALVAFGGAGPLHGGALIREVGIGTMLVPQIPGRALRHGMRDRRCALRLSRKRSSGGSMRSSADRSQRSWSPSRNRARRQLKANDLSIEDDPRRARGGHVLYRADPFAASSRSNATGPRARMREAFLEAYRQEFGNTLGRNPGRDRQSAHVWPPATRRHRFFNPNASESGCAGAPPATRRFISASDATRRSIIATICCPDTVRGAGGRRADPTRRPLIEPGMEVRVDAAGNLLVGVK